MRPLGGVVAAGVAALAFAGVASMSFAGPSAQPPLTKAAAAKATRHLRDAIELEHEAGHEIADAEAARLKLGISALALSAAFDALDGTSAQAAAEAVGNAADSDTRAIAFLKKSPQTKKTRREALADIALATKQKHTALAKIAAALAAETPPPPKPAPQPGPLEGCVFITNNGTTSTENVKVSDPGGAGRSGSVLFLGQGLNTTNQITLDANGGASSPFTVGVFGTSSITITVFGTNGSNQTLMFPFTLNQGNDVTGTDCTTHQ
jgi:hypothetical protein